MYARGRVFAVSTLLAVTLATACGGEPSDAQYAPNLDSNQEAIVCTEPEPDLPEGTIFKGLARPDLERNAAQGSLQDIDFWPCNRPGGSEGEFDIVAVTGTTAAVTGSTADIEIEWSGPDSIAGRNLLFWTGSGGGTRIRNGRVTHGIGGSGYYRYVIPDDANPLRVQLVFETDATGNEYELSFAIDDTVGDPTSPRIGSSGRQQLLLIEVGSGDIQINLNWQELVDLDLHVTDPSPFEIYFGATESPSGGMLDLDSYPACNFEHDRGRGNENVFWPLGLAPGGRYLVQVHMWSDCGTYDRGVPTPYRVTIVSHGELQVIEGVFDPSEPTTLTDDLHDVAAFVF